ncbi:MAG: hypothetical protein AB2A00_10370 [Myxococcota bacterium]
MGALPTWFARFALVLACVAMGGGDCGGGSSPGCTSDGDCGDGAYCSSADGLCYVLGSCVAAADCAEQNLTHTNCTGAWSCVSQSCEWTCSGPLPGRGQTCGAGDACASGLECIHYYGVAGPSGPEFRTCEKRCTADADCGFGSACVNVTDGPGRVCRNRNG